MYDITNYAELRGCLFIYLFYFKQYLARGALPRPDEKEKNNNTRQIKIKNGATKYNKRTGGSIRLGSKVLIQTKRKLIIRLTPQGQRKHVPDLGSAEPEGALVPMARVI